MKTRCECRDLSFTGLLAYARRHGITTLDELVEATGAGTGCGSCRPLLEELLKTGKLRCGDQLIDLADAEKMSDCPPADEPPPEGGDDV